MFSVLSTFWQHCNPDNHSSIKSKSETVTMTTTLNNRNTIMIYLHCFRELANIFFNRAMGSEKSTYHVVYMF